MPRYHYTARAADGQEFQAIAESPSLPALAARVQASGGAVESAREIRPNVPRIRGVPYFEIIGIYRQVAASLQAGLPLAETLELLATETSNARVKSLLHFVKSQIEEGAALSEAMREFPDAFPKVHIAAVRAGEESGRLEFALAELAEQAETFSNMNRRFASSLVYPAVIAFAALGLFLFAFTFIVPKFSVLFFDLGIRDLPLATQVVLYFGARIAPIALLILAGVAVLMSVIAVQRKASTGRLWIDAWKLRLPVIGQIVEKSALARFSGTLGLLIDAGVDLPQAIRLAAEGAGNTTVEQLLKNVSADVELGNTFADSVNKLTAMPPTMAWRIGVGEETGTLPDSLLHASRLYSRQVESLVTSAAGLLEPFMIILIGSGVAMLVLGMFLPLVAVIQNLSGGG